MDLDGILRDYFFLFIKNEECKEKTDYVYGE